MVEVVRAESEATASPARLQVSVSGRSPRLTLHIMTAVWPWLTGPLPKVKGAI